MSSLKALPVALFAAVILWSCEAVVSDVGLPDAGVRPDAGVGIDASVEADAGAADAGDVDAGVDAGMKDAGAPLVIFPRTGITAAELGVLVNDDDPLSVSIAAYYVAARRIPPANVVHLHVPAGTTLTAVAFAPLKTQVDAAFLSTPVQAMAITWTTPFAVENMSITSAFAMGFRAIADTCTDPNSQGASSNPYLRTPGSTRPFSDLGFRPAMVIAATTQQQAQDLIDRGLASDDTWPGGSAYLMSTSDGVRSARCVFNAMYGYTNECQTFLNTWDAAGSGIDAGIVSADSISNMTDVLFYVQGLASVPNITTNTFLPGAIADHLTSYGGQIPVSGQMSAIEFLRGGATGSFGTVVEPCAYTQKFPNPIVLIPRYFGGATLIEAYWKSVAWPAEGIFLGEPLARPFGQGFRSSYANSTLTIETTAMAPGRTYVIEAADSPAGPFTVVVGNLTVTRYTRSRFTVPNATRAVYRFRE